MKPDTARDVGATDQLITPFLFMFLGHYFFFSASENTTAVS